MVVLDMRARNAQLAVKRFSVLAQSVCITDQTPRAGTARHTQQWLPMIRKVKLCSSAPELLQPSRAEGSDTLQRGGKGGIGPCESADGPAVGGW